MSEETQTQDQQTADPQASAPAAPAPEQTSDVKAAPGADETKAQFEREPLPDADPLQPLLDLIEAQGKLLSDLTDTVNNLGDRLADVEKAVDGITTSDGMAAIVKGAVAAAITHVGSEFGTLLEDVRKMKAKLHHM